MKANSKTQNACKEVNGTIEKKSCESDKKKRDIVVEIDKSNNYHKNVPETSVFGFPRPNQVTLVYHQKSYPYEAVALDYKPVKNYFLGLVFVLLNLMLLFTAVINIVVFYMKDSDILSDPIRDFCKEYILYLLISPIILLIFVNFAMNHMVQTRTLPGNLVGLASAVICVSILTSYVTIWFNTQIVTLVLIVAAFTYFLCIPLVFFRFNFKSWVMFPLVVTIATATLGGLSMYLIPYKILPLLERWIPQFHYPAMNIYILYACTLGYVIVLAIDLRLILGGNAVDLAETDFPLGAFLLYIAFADIFIKTSQITGCLDGL